MITDVAIRYDGKTYALPSPARHADVRQLIFKERGGIAGPHTDGFLVGNRANPESKMFLNRGAAYFYAQITGQIKAGVIVKSGKLYSEDLW